MFRHVIYKTIFCFLVAWALAPVTAPASSPVPIPEQLPVKDLRPGDVILIDLGCYLCSAINRTTGSPFNHSGLVIESGVADGVPKIAQSLTGTETIPLPQFLRQAKGGTPIVIRRPTELQQLFLSDRDTWDMRIQLLKKRFTQSMEGRPFDDAFLWDNWAEDGGELLYCSEMIQKTLAAALSRPLPTAPMDFAPMWDFWASYFGGQVPQGLPGNSPATFAKSPDFETIWSGFAP